jgi:hypothetical protein
MKTYRRSAPLEVPLCRNTPQWSLQSLPQQRDLANCQGTLAAYLPVTGQGRINGCGSAKAGWVSSATPAWRHAVSDIYTTDHNRLPSVDCDAFGLTANVSGIKVWVIPLHQPSAWVGTTSKGEGQVPQRSSTTTPSQAPSGGVASQPPLSETPHWTASLLASWAFYSASLANISTTPEQLSSHPAPNSSTAKQSESNNYSQWRSSNCVQNNMWWPRTEHFSVQWVAVQHTKQRPIQKNKLVLSSDKQERASNVKQFMARDMGAEKTDRL